jgi:hypothetical protein
VAQALRDLVDDVTRPGVASWPPVPYTLAGTPASFAGHDAAWAPRTDVFEQEGETLTISGERRSDRTVRAHDYYYREGTSGSFARRLALRFPVEAGQAHTAFADGVLELRLPLPPRETPRPQVIPVD